MRKIAMIAGLLVATATAARAVPQLLSIQGTLTENGYPVEGTRSTTFQIFDTELGGTSSFSETDSIVFSGGVFNAFVGTNSVGGIPLSIFNGGDKYMEVSLGTTTFQRQRIVSVGYAFRAAQAEALAAGATAQFQLLDVTTMTVNIITATSSITASAFFGDGSHLSGIASSSSLAGLYVSKASDTMNGPLTVPSLTISTFAVSDFSDINFNGTNAGRLISRHGLGAIIGTDPIDSTANFTILAGAGETELFNVGQNGEADFGEHLTIRNSSLTLTSANGYIVSDSSINASAFFGDGSHLTGVLGTDSSKVAKTGDTMTGALDLVNVALNLTGASGNIVGQASMTASAFFGDGSHLTGIAPGGETAYFASAKTYGSSITAFGAILAGSSMTASAFFGDGSHLANVNGTDSSKVAKTGDTMTGALNLDNAAVNMTGASGNVVSQASVTASAFFGDGSHLSGIVGETPYFSSAKTYGSSITAVDAIIAGSSMTASAFFGDGSHLTGVSGTDSSKVSKAGDTMTGSLTLSNAGLTLNGASGNVIGQASMTASAFFGDGSHLTGIAPGGETSYFALDKTYGSSVTVANAILAGSSMTASAFFGDGSHLTGVTGVDGSKVAKTGDSMSGALNMTNAGINLTGASGNVVGQASMTASAFFGDGSHLTGIASGGETSYFSGAKTYGSSITAVDAILTGSSMTASAFFGDGSHLSGLTSEISYFGPSKTFGSSVTASGAVQAGSSMTASAFFGDGSHLTGLPASSESNTFSSSKTFTSDVLIYSSATASAFFGDGSHLTGLPTLGGDFSVSGDTITPLTTNATAYFIGNGQGSSYFKSGRYFIDSTHYTEPAFILAEGYGVSGGPGRLHLSSGRDRSGLFSTTASSITIGTNGIYVYANGGNGLEVNGGMTFNGQISAGGNISLAGALTAGSSVTASAFFGDGSHLTGLGSASQISAFGMDVTPTDSVGLYLNTGSNPVYINPIGPGPAGQLAISNGSSSNAIYFHGTGSSYFSDSTSKLGIGTSQPATKLHVSSGVITVDGSSAGLKVVGGSVTANAFFGDGSHLSGVATPESGATSVRPSPLTVWSGALTTGIPGSLTTGIVALMNFPTRIVASHLSYYVAATPTSGTYKICVYSDSGNTKLIDVTSGANSSLGIKTVAISPSVDLPAGNYYVLVGWATTTTSTTIEKWASPTLAGFSTGTSPNVVYEGTISKTSGACDSTIDPTSITAAINDSPLIRFDNN